MQKLWKVENVENFLKFRNSVDRSLSLREQQGALANEMTQRQFLSFLILFLFPIISTCEKIPLGKFE